MRNIIKKNLLVLILTAAVIMSTGYPAYADGGYSSEYYATVWYDYYDEYDSSVDIRFYTEPAVPMKFTCGSWSCVHPYHYNSMVVSHEPDYYFASRVCDLGETDFENGTDLVLESYPVPEGFEALNKPTIARNINSLIGDDRQVPFQILLKKKDETVPIDKLGVYIELENVEKYSDGSSIWPYTGEPVCPEVYAVGTSAAGIDLVEGVDYTISYENNVEPGDPLIVVNGIGKYSGSASFMYRYQIFDYGTSGGGSSSENEPAYSGPSYKQSFSKGNNKFKVIDKANGSVAFTGVKSKKSSVTIPNKVTYGDKTYKVTAIADKAFYNNKKIKSVTIGSNIKKIGKNAFRNCSKLKTIKINSKVLKKVGSKSFKGISKKAVIKVPAKKLKAYKKLLKGKGQAKTVKIKRK